MADGAEDLTNKLRKIRTRFTDALPDRMAEINALDASLRAARDEKAFDEACAELLFPVHKLAGAAAAMGHPRLGVIAAKVEGLIDTWRDGRACLTPDESDTLDALLADMADAASRSAIEASGEDASALRMNLEQEMEQPVLLLNGDREAGCDTAQQLGNFGYAVVDFHDGAAFENAARYIRPEALVIDIEMPEGLEEGLAAMDTVSALRPTVPLIVTTAHNDIKTRLRTVRAGVDSVLPHPVDLHELVQALDRNTVAGDAPPYRVLIVEDDHEMAFFYETLLRDAGMEAQCVSDPLQVLEPLNAFDPDLILMDVNMPQCSGIELASIIRQSRSYLQVPIVFLTSEQGAKTHLYAVRAGGDDFLRKPVDRRMLLASVRARADRARLLKTLITSDSMTGLLNHSSIMESLATELLRAKRQERPMSFAMIDIDHFKLVNDTHGHWVGDTVIKALSQVLRQRLRRTDVIGRYGGEEFAVILPDTDEAQAARLLDDIRESFVKIRHRGDGEDFHVTFSVGISSYPDSQEISRIATLADEVLYSAKQAGRNRVLTASSVGPGDAHMADG